VRERERETREKESSWRWPSQQREHGRGSAEREREREGSWRRGAKGVYLEHGASHKAHVWTTVLVIRQVASLGELAAKRGFSLYILLKNGGKGGTAGGGGIES
jgi:hypothetical protein